MLKKTGWRKISAEAEDERKSGKWEVGQAFGYHLGSAPYIASSMIICLGTTVLVQARPKNHAFFPILDAWVAGKLTLRVVGDGTVLALQCDDGRILPVNQVLVGDLCLDSILNEGIKAVRSALIEFEPSRFRIKTKLQ
jgi:hypothetical protein